MKVPRAFVGRAVRITWLDPCSFDHEELPTRVPAEVPKGRGALARWEEYGVIAAVEDGVVTFVHAKVESTINTKARYQGSVVPEDLIELIEELVVKPGGGAAVDANKSS